MYFKREDGNAPDKRACNVYDVDDVTRCWGATVKFNSANILYARFWAKLPNLKTANVSGYTVVIKSLTTL